MFNLIHGRKLPNGDRVRGLLERGILSEIAKANTGKKRPATYRLNEGAMIEDPKVATYLGREKNDTLVDTQRTPIPGKAAQERAKNSLGTRKAAYAQTSSSDLETPANVAGVNDRTPATIARTMGLDSGNNRKSTPASIATDSRYDPPLTKPLTLHAQDRALNLNQWLAIKEMLRSELSTQEWDLWVRPARLLRMMSDNVMLIGIPPNGSIIAAACARKSLLDETARRAGVSAVLTKYPDDLEREQLKERYGIDLGRGATA